VLRETQEVFPFMSDAERAVAVGRALGADGASRAAARADRVTPGWVDAARLFAERFVLEHKRFTAEDLRSAARGILADPPDSRAWGVVLRALANAQRIRAAGFGRSKNPKAHARPIAIWEVNHAV
jgi:hypothetical protein